MRRLRWRYARLCLTCFCPTYEEGGQVLRVEFRGGYFVSVVVCAGCARVLDRRGTVQVVQQGRTLEVEKRYGVGPHRIRGDQTWSCKGVWL